jgi:hypothetical protein
MKPNCIFIVFGQFVERDFSNVKSVVTKVVPNIGERIFFEGYKYKVHDKLINYTSVEDFDDMEDSRRGKEVIWIFV